MMSVFRALTRGAHSAAAPSKWSDHARARREKSYCAAHRGAPSMKSTRCELKKRHTVTRQTQGSASKSCPREGRVRRSRAPTARPGSATLAGSRERLNAASSAPRRIEAAERQHRIGGGEEFDVAGDQQRLLLAPVRAGGGSRAAPRTGRAPAPRPTSARCCCGTGSQGSPLEKPAALARIPGHRRAAAVAALERRARTRCRTDRAALRKARRLRRGRALRPGTRTPSRAASRPARSAASRSAALAHAAAPATDHALDVVVGDRPARPALRRALLRGSRPWRGCARASCRRSAARSCSAMCRRPGCVYSATVAVESSEEISPSATTSGIFVEQPRACSSRNGSISGCVLL